MKKNKISVCLAVYNEEKNIVRCLRSVKNLANEIIVVDGGSSDKTPFLAKSLGAKVINTTNKEMFHFNKQMAIDEATKDWVLLLDADEEVSPSLEREILSVIKKNNKLDGFWIPRKNIIFGKWIKHTGWWPDYQLRLFKRGKLKFPCQSVHEHPFLRGETGKLTNPLIHHHYQNISQYLKKLDLYTENDKKVWLKEDKKIEWYQAITLPSEEFIKRFLIWKGYKDGLHGLLLSLLQSFYQLVVFAKVWEKRGFPSQKLTSKEVYLNLIKAVKNLEWWRYELKIKRTNSVVKKYYYRFLRKLNLFLWKK